MSALIAALACLAVASIAFPLPGNPQLTGDDASERDWFGDKCTMDVEIISSTNGQKCGGSWRDSSNTTILWGVCDPFNDYCAETGGESNPSQGTCQGLRSAGTECMYHMECEEARLSRRLEACLREEPYSACQGLDIEFSVRTIGRKFIDGAATIPAVHYEDECRALGLAPIPDVTAALNGAATTLDLTALGLDTAALLPVIAVLGTETCIDTLILASNRVDRLGARALASLLSAGPSGERAAPLASLDLTGNPVGDRGACELAAGLKAPSCALQRLVARRAGLSDAGASALLDAVYANTSLRNVDIYENSVSEALMGQLTAALERRLVPEAPRESRVATAAAVGSCSPISALGFPVRIARDEAEPMCGLADAPTAPSEARSDMALSPGQPSPTAYAAYAEDRLYTTTVRVAAPPRETNEVVELRKRVAVLEETVADMRRAIRTRDRLLEKANADLAAMQTNTQDRINAVTMTQELTKEKLREDAIQQRALAKSLREQSVMQSQTLVKERHRADTAEASLRRAVATRDQAIREAVRDALQKQEERHQREMQDLLIKATERGPIRRMPSTKSPPPDL
eukprot:m51a1_g11930 hypothetical protein (576) ;mRNA; r:696546-699726